uniref:Uncharacterized protein n=1 Tax=Odontella aurita TaxID=265563 RepID=A0A6U6L5I5_9STRA|mmetsp:Transcript_65/g.118  ORF Transcript_65/g.118 Transcript_65/m.118 type:complete len:128 (+) Transcript_65:68-451(+)
MNTCVCNSYQMIPLELLASLAVNSPNNPFLSDEKVLVAISGKLIDNCGTIVTITMAQGGVDPHHSLHMHPAGSLQFISKFIDYVGLMDLTPPMSIVECVPHRVKVCMPWKMNSSCQHFFSSFFTQGH